MSNPQIAVNTQTANYSANFVVAIPYPYFGAERANKAILTPNNSALELRRTLWTPIIEKYGLEYKVDIKSMLFVAECESGFNSEAWNKNDPNGGSFGIYQYQKETFYNNAFFNEPDIWNAEQQIELTAFLFSKNKQGLWACWWKYIGEPIPWLTIKS